MDELERLDNSLVAVKWVTNSFNPDVQIIIQMCILSSLLPQLFLLQSYEYDNIFIPLIQLLQQVQKPGSIPTGFWVNGKPT